MKLRRTAHIITQTSSLALTVALGIPVAVTFPGVAFAQEARQSFNIPAGDLAGALQVFSAQTGMQLVFSSDLVAGKRSPGVSGEMSPQDALGRLLAGTGLSGRVSGNSATLVPVGTVSDLGAVDGERVLGPVRVEGSQGGPHSSPVRGEGIAQLGGERGGQDEEADGFRARIASVATGTPVALEDIPRSVSVVTQEQIEKQDITDIGKALQRAPGVVIGEVGGNTGQAEIFIRGLPVERFQIDGGGALPLAIIGNGRLNLDAFERVEIVRGPNGLFSGEGSPGGSINLVRKRPSSAPFLSVRAEAGTEGRYGAALDFSTPSLAGSPLAFRAVASFRQDPSFVDHLKLKSGTLYGILDAPLGTSARLEVGANYTFSRSRGSYWGVTSAVEGPPLDLPRSFNVDIPQAYVDADVLDIFAKAYVDVAENWDVEIGANYRLQSDSAITAGPNFLLRADGSSVYPLDIGGIDVYDAGKSRSDTFDVLAKVTGRFSTFFLDHNVFASANYTTYSSNSRPFTQILRANINSIDDLRNPLFFPVDFGSLSPLFYKNTSSLTGLVFGDTVSWNDKVFLTATLRRDFVSRGSIHAEQGSLFPGMIGSVFIDANPVSSTWRPSYALSVKPLKDLTLYASYADSFDRQDGSYSREGEDPNFTYTQLAPSTYNNYEGGLRYTLGRLLLSLSAYHQEWTGVARADGTLRACPPNSGNGGFLSQCYVAGGQNLKSRGFDIEANGRLAPNLQIALNYNYNKSTYSGENSSAGDIVQTLSPQSSANLLIDWSPPFAQRSSVQIGARYKSRYYSAGTRTIYDPDGNPLGSEDYEIDQPAWLVFDLGMDYRLTKKASLRLFVENVANKKYLSTPLASAPTGGFYGSPRTFMASLTWRNDSLASKRTFDDQIAPFGSARDWYGALDTGLAFTDAIDATADGNAQDGISDVRWKFRTRTRPMFAARIGYYVTPSIRAELDGQYRSAGWARIGGGDAAPYGVCGASGALQGADFDCGKVPGKIDTWSLTGNVIFEPGRRDDFIRPFVGGGLGISRYSVQFFGKMDGVGSDDPWATVSCRPNRPCNVIPDTVRQLQESISSVDVGKAFTLQALAGLSVRLNDRLRVDAQWRYVHMPNIRWRTFNIDRPANYGEVLPLTPAVGTFEGDYGSHALSVGFRWAFGSTSK